MPSRLVAAPPARTLLRRDAATALVWFVVIVPPAFGFWLVAGDLAGVPPGDRQTLIVASMLCLGLATLAQAVLGHRLPIFDGPASTYLAALAVVSAGSAAGRPEAVAGGLVAAGVVVFALGLVGADRLIRRIFTPPIVAVFMLVVTLAVVPATVERAIGRSDAHAWGTSAAWLSSTVVVGVALGAQAVPRLRSYALLAALVGGTVAYVALAGLPAAGPSAWDLPTVFPWGTPEITTTVLAPFVIAGALASFNTVASINVMATTLDEPLPPRSERRGLLAHGMTQAINGVLGNVLGNVSRLESSAIVQMIGNPRPRALALAASGIIVLAFVGPAAGALARLPISVSAALVTVVLGMMALQGLRQTAQLEVRRRWLVVAPAVAPSVVWLVVADDLSEHLQLLANPMLIGVLLAVALDRVVRRPAAVCDV